MTEKRKIFIIGGFIALLILLIPLTSYINKQEGNKIMKAFHSLFQEGETNVLYIGRDDCSHCQTYSPVLQKTAETYDFEYFYINTNQITKSQLKEVLNKLDVDVETFGTPYTVILKDGKKADEKVGEIDESALFAFMQKNGVINKDQTYEGIGINYQQYETLINGKEQNIFIYGSSQCGVCTQAKPILEEIAKENKIKLNYIDLQTLNEEEYNKLMDSVTFLKTEEWGTPLTLIVKDKKVVKSQRGFQDKASYVAFLKENGIIK